MIIVGEVIATVEPEERAPRASEGGTRAAPTSRQTTRRRIVSELNRLTRTRVRLDAT